MDNVTYYTDKVLFVIDKINTGELHVDIKLGYFAGSYDFCIEDYNLNIYVKNLQQLSNNLYGEFNFRDMDSDSFILFRMKNFGKMEVSGQLGSFINGNYLNFRFEADQTLLTLLIDLLKNIE